MDKKTKTIKDEIPSFIETNELGSSKMVTLALENCPTMKLWSILFEKEISTDSLDYINLLNSEV